MTGAILNLASRPFDVLDHRWQSPATRRRVASLLIAVFLLGLLVIEMGRRG